jgi:TPR repeat protein
LADQGDADAQFRYGVLLYDGDGISTNKSLAAHYYKLSADQGHAEAQFRYGVLLDRGDGITMNKSLAAHYYKLSADQGYAPAQFCYGVLLGNEDGIALNESRASENLNLPADQEIADAQHKSAQHLLDGGDAKQTETIDAECLRRAADQGLISAQLQFATLHREGRVIERNLSLSAHYFKLAADQGSIEGQIEYAESILSGNGVPGTVQSGDSEHYLRLAVAQGDSKAQMRLGIALLSGLFGRFDFVEARQMFGLVSESEHDLTRFAIVLRNSLSKSDCALLSGSDFSKTANIFSVLRSSLDESIPLIRILNAHLGSEVQFADYMLSKWQDIAGLAMAYLVDLSHIRTVSGHSNPLGVLGSLPTDLVSCNSISDMIPIVFKMYSIECSLYRNVNHFLRYFPIGIVSKFMKELGGILHYIYLLQSSIEYCSHHQPLSCDIIVYRGIPQQGKMLAPLCESMIGEVIVWPGFTSTSTDRNLVISRFINDEDSLLFEISLHPGDVAVAIQDYSEHPHEAEIVIAASSGFRIDDVEWIDIRGCKIGQVRLSYCFSWYDFNIDDPPVPILV